MKSTIRMNLFLFFFLGLGLASPQARSQSTPRSEQIEKQQHEKLIENITGLLNGAGTDSKACNSTPPLPELLLPQIKELFAQAAKRYSSSNPLDVCDPELTMYFIHKYGDPLLKGGDAFYPKGSAAAFTSERGDERIPCDLRVVQGRIIIVPVQAALSSGGFKKVWPGVDISTHQLIAVIRQNYASGDSEKESYLRSRIQNEINLSILLAGSGDKNVSSIAEAPYLNQEIKQDKEFISYQKLYDGDLYHLRAFNIKKGAPSPNFIQVLHDMMSAVASLHEKNVPHQDLKLENFLFTNPSQPRAFLSDFGFAGKPSEPRSAWGTFPYYSPEFVSYFKDDLITNYGKGVPRRHEVIQKEDLDPFKVDSWNLGLALYEFMMLSPSYDTIKYLDYAPPATYRTRKPQNPVPLLEKIMAMKTPEALKAFGISCTISDPLLDIICGLMHPNPKLRITPQEALGKLEDFCMANPAFNMGCEHLIPIAKNKNP